MFVDSSARAVVVAGVCLLASCGSAGSDSSPTASGEPTGSVATTTVVATTTATTTAATVTGYGSADIEPQVVSRGDIFTITPSAEIQPLCLQFAKVWTSASQSEPPFVINPAGRLDATTEPSVPACSAERSSASVSYQVSKDFPEGTFILCLTEDMTPEGCATFLVRPDP